MIETVWHSSPIPTEGATRPLGADILINNSLNKNVSTVLIKLLQKHILIGSSDCLMLNNLHRDLNIW
jgi:hypothetical protein